METNQRLQRACVKFGAVVGRIQQSTMEIPVDRACGELPDLPDMRTQNFPPRLFRQPLRDGHNRHQNGGSCQARNDEHDRIELTW